MRPLADSRRRGVESGIDSRSALLLVLAFVLLPWITGCATGGGGGGFFRVGEIVDEPWTIPDGSYPTQRLFRVRYEGPAGKAGFKLTLYLHGESQFRMQAADGLGRKVWDLSVDDRDQALWLDHRSEEYCRADAASRLAIVPLADMPVVALPKLLLGRMPSIPATALYLNDEQVSYLDARGRLWSGGLRQGRLEWWSQKESGVEVTWWRHEDDEDVFVDSVGSQQLHWREVVSEPLVRPPELPEVPKSYHERICTDARRPAVEG